MGFSLLISIKKTYYNFTQVCDPSIPQQDKLQKVKQMQQPGALKRGQMKATKTYTPLSPKFDRRSNATNSKN